MTPIYFGPNSFPVENRFVGDFVSRLIWGEPGKIDRYCTMAVMDGVKLVGGTVYHNYHPDHGTIELTSASTSKRWLTRPVIRAMFHLPFGILGCQLVLLRVSERNKGMLRIARNFGFDEIYIPRLLGRDEGAFLFTLTDDAWASSRYNR